MSYNNGASYSSYGGSNYARSSPYYSSNNAGGSQQNEAQAVLRRRNAAKPESSVEKKTSVRNPATSVVQKMDFLFPKVDSDFTVQTDRGGVTSVVAYVLILVLIFFETRQWLQQNQAITEHMYVDQTLGKKMQVNVNITFPALACEDLHVDAMDVAGDSQLDIDETLVKRKLHLDGRPLSNEEIREEANKHRQAQEKRDRLSNEQVPDDYCGPCYGADENEGQCCNTCEELLEAYRKKGWKIDTLFMTSEQCIREGRDQNQAKRMTKGQGCNLSGYMKVNRVAGNFHIAMGEGIERNGRHIHVFVPEDAPNFNASHIIHELTFGPTHSHHLTDPEGGVASVAPLNDVTKIVDDNHGTTGLFQYFIKVVPTTYIGMGVDDAATESEKEDRDSKVKKRKAREVLTDTRTSAMVKVMKTLAIFFYPSDNDSSPMDVFDTNRYFFTERFRPLITYDDEHEHLLKKDDANDEKAAADAGHSHVSKNENHKRQNAVLPGVFFIYEIYPFAVELSRSTVPITHLFIRVMASVGGVFTVFKLVDSVLYERSRK